MSRYAIIVLGYSWYEIPFSNLEGYTVTRQLKMLDRNPEEVALVVFSGGEDLEPFMYGGQDFRNLCYTNHQRDYFEKRVFNHCRKHFIKMTGICRGFQFLNVLSGGQMYQHVNYHYDGNHLARFSWKSEDYFVSSSHHQLVKLPSDAVPVVWSTNRRSNIYIGPRGEIAAPPAKEVEAAIFPSTKSMGVQFHPERMKSNSSGYQAYLEFLTDYLEKDFDDFLAKYSEVSHARARSAGTP